MPDIDAQIKEIEDQIEADEQAEMVGDFFNNDEKRKERAERKKNNAAGPDYSGVAELFGQADKDKADADKRAERKKRKQNAGADYEAAGQFMAGEEKRRERAEKKKSGANYKAAGQFMVDEEKRRERAEKKKAAQEPAEPIDLGEFFETDEEKIIRQYVDKKNKDIEGLKKKSEEQKKAVAKAAKGKRKKIAAIEERDKTIAERDAAMAKQKSKIESTRFEIESIKRNKKDLIASKKNKSLMDTEGAEEKDNAKVDVEAATKAVGSRKEIVKMLTDKKTKADAQMKKLKAAKAKEKKSEEDAKVGQGIADSIEGISDDAKTFLDTSAGAGEKEKEEAPVEEKKKEEAKETPAADATEKDGAKADEKGATAKEEEKKTEEKAEDKADADKAKDAAKEAETAKQQTNISINVDGASININIGGGATDNSKDATEKEKKEEKKKEKKEEKKVDPQDEALSKISMEELEKVISTLDEQLKKQNEELEKEEATLKEKQKAMEDASQKSSKAQADVKVIDEELKLLDKQLKQKEEELQKMEEEHAKDTEGWDEYKEKQEERKKEKWYQDYLAEKNKLDELNGQIASDEEAVQKIQSGDRERFKFKTLGTGAETHSIMVDLESGEAQGVGDQLSQEDEQAAEEIRVEEALKNAPVLKELNKDELPKYIGYDPNTGEMGGTKKEENATQETAPKEGGEKKTEDAGEQISAKEEEAKAADKVLNHKSAAALDAKLKDKVGFEPIKTLTIDIRDNGIEKAHKTAQDIMGKIRDSKMEASGTAAQVMTMIITSLDILFDGGKEDSILAALEGKADDFISSKVKKTSLFALMVQGLDQYKVKDDDTSANSTEEKSEEKKEEKKEEKPEETPSEEEKKEPEKTGFQKANDFISANKDNAKGLMKTVTKSIDTHKLLGEAKAFKGKNDKFARMLEGAYRTQVADTTTGAITSAAGIAKSAIETFAGVDGVLGKVVGGLFTGIGMLTGKVASSIAQKRDKTKVLESPEVLGKVKYDKKKVPEYKFNEILKRVSGITSKDGLYNVVKVTDAVTLHSSMKANNSDPMVGRVMGDLGYKDQTEYSKVKVTDILAKSGHPTGDWRGELKKSMVDEGQTKKKTFGQKVKGFAKKVWGGIKSLF